LPIDPGVNQGYRDTAQAFILHHMITFVSIALLSALMGALAVRYGADSRPGIDGDQRFLHA